jgi:hypothetical protein
VVGDLFDLRRGADVFGILTGKVGAGDLEAVEEQARSFGVDLVVGDAEKDLADGELDGSAVFGQREVESVAVFAGARVWRGAAGGVVVVAEVFSAERWAAAATAFGEDVTALEALGFVLHGSTPPGYF